MRIPSTATSGLGEVICNVCGEPANHRNVQPDVDYCDMHYNEYLQGLEDKSLEQDLETELDW